MFYKIEEFLCEDGTSPSEEWFMALDSVAAAKITIVKLKMEQGNLSNVKWFRGIGEYRLDWGPGYRIYIALDGKNLIILLGGGTKKGQQKDIVRAENFWKEYKGRKTQPKK
ncbi:MAG: type II toxin-antitoxin system RelE/ParE family toxin [Candidatus Riflebacteria bacterium]|nr:type II toxin-antitoxin system RelE/ParE family toxin [Candidatus Riflebacteria bacterium]